MIFHSSPIVSRRAVARRPILGILLLWGCAAFGPLGAVAQIWQEDATFAPVLESSTPSNFIGAIAAAPGGKVLVSLTYPFGSINGVAGTLLRLNTDGTIDPTFSAPDHLSLPFATYSDGRYLTGAGAGTPDSPINNLTLIRRFSDGQLDPTFAPRQISLSGSFSVQILPDERILLAAFVGSIEGREGLCILDADGSVSPSFHASLLIGTRYFSLQVAPLVDGRFILAGNIHPVGGTTSRRIARLLADGSMDPTFSADLSSYSGPFVRVFPEPDGRLLVFLGLPDPGLVRLEPDGAIDATFPFRRFNAPDGQPLALVNPLSRQPDGKILIASSNNSGRATLSRINSDGTADPTFVLPAPAGYSTPLHFSDGTMIFGTPITEARQRSRAMITRVWPDGTIDANFSPRVSMSARADAIAFEPDGNVFVAGAFDYAAGVRVSDKYALVRLTADGRHDSTFTATLAATDSVKVMQRQPDGALVTAGSFTVGGTTRSFARFRSDGSRDLSFTLPDALSSNFKLDAAGRIYAMRSDGSAFLLERFLANGVSDPSFAPLTLHRPAFAIWPDGSGAGAVLAAGQAPRIVYTLVRFSSNGTVDSSYTIDPANLPQDPLELVAIPGGAVVALGHTHQHSSELSYVRFTSSGAADYVFRTASALGTSLPDVAGVLFDALRDSAAPAGTRARADLGTGYTVEVDTTGHAGTLDGDYVGSSSPSRIALYQRSAASGPSVRAAPVVLSVHHDPLAELVNLGGTAKLGVEATGMLPLTYQWKKAGVPISGATGPTLTLANFSAADAGSYTVDVGNLYGSVSSASVDVTANAQLERPLIPDSYGRTTRVVNPDEAMSLLIQVLGNPLPTLTWYFNGRPFSAGTSIRTNRTDAWAALEIEHVQPADTGVYWLHLANSVSSFVGPPVVVGITSTTKTLGTATEFRADIQHPNGNVYDQALLTGGGASITADPRQVTRTSFTDFNGDIVQVEFSGAGTLSIVLDSVTPPAPAANYNQPAVSYVTGHARIVVVDADETTHLTVFSVGRANAVDQTLFRDGTDYDGMADIACIMISTRNGKFGGLRCGNASFFASSGFTGIYAPNTQFTGPMYVGEINAFDDAQPVLITGSGSTEPWITGGNLWQPNGRPVLVEGLTRVHFTDGTDSHGRAQPVQPNQGRFERLGADVTSSVVVGP